MPDHIFLAVVVSGWPISMVIMRSGYGFGVLESVLAYPLSYVGLSIAITLARFFAPRGGS